MPWEAFVTQTSGADPQYLLDDHAISYIPSGSLLALVRVTSRKLTQHRAPLLAFANPAYDDTGTAAIRGAFDQLRFDALRDDAGGGFSALPGSESEAYEVRDALKAGDDSVIEGEAATKAHVLALNKTHQLAQYRYLLFATHAVLPNDVQGINQPALVLAHPSHDGFLTMGEIFGLSLDADFVALSACNTGEGARQPGEGISGMTRAFLYAGTPAISVTLWEVDDQAAAQITPAFFRWNDHWAFGG
jgi:CHAT domain-containing protein